MTPASQRRTPRSPCAAHVHNPRLRPAVQEALLDGVAGLASLQCEVRRAAALDSLVDQATLEEIDKGADRGGAPHNRLHAARDLFTVDAGVRGCDRHG